MNVDHLVYIAEKFGLDCGFQFMYQASAVSKTVVSDLCISNYTNGGRGYGIKGWSGIVLFYNLTKAQAEEIVHHMKETEILFV